jgi:sulfhydrogenase subunit beta (sulfur reductase)
MSDYFLNEKDIADFVQRMMEAKPLYGPIAKKNKYTFAKIEAPNELKLDYDISILPPKKVMFPTKQNLLEFSAKGPKSAIAPVEKILFGVHFYDVKAIDMLDHVFAEKNVDNNYLANRKATTIVASSIQNVNPRAFFGSVGTEVKPKGHDAFITKIKGGYHFQALTPKGEALVKLGSFSKASGDQVEEAKRVNQDAMNKCQEKLKYDSKKNAEKVRAAFGNEKVWHEHSKDCFSCGTCNIVCPTCYCFDVQDVWNLDQVSGVRYRQWDACLTEDFAKVSLGPTGAENFREEKAERMRHRIMRKAAYLNQKLGGPACVGCGRCSVGCVPDIADPVKIINNIVEA